jgi:hypothetical protein
MQPNGFQQYRVNGLAALLLVVLFFVGFYYISKGIFWLLTVVSPVMLIATLLLDYQVVLKYLKWVYKQLQSNVLFGLLMVLLTVVGYPIVLALLLGRAVLSWRVRKMRREQEEALPGDYIDFEEIDEDPLDLPPPPERPKPRREERNDYDQYFD